MSSINNIITTSFRAVGGNQVAAQLGSMAGGFGRLGTQIQANARMSERLGAQWKAIATTIRYSIAGGAVFGLTRMLGQIRDINVQLGQMQALSEIGTGIRYSTNDINNLFANLQSTAANTITPLKEVNDAAINFLSTVQDVSPNDLPKMLEQIGQGAKLAQTPMDTLTQSATTMQIAFGRAVNPQTIGQFERMWVRLIGIAPGGVTAAPAIAGALPGLASMFQMAPGKGITPGQVQAQMMALTQGVLQTGMPASTAMRGLTYLVQSIAQPTGGAKKALASIGITPEFVEQKGITAATLKLLNTIQPVGKRRAGMLGQIPDESLTDESTLPGIPAAEMTRLRAMVPRIHGIRAAIILASQLQQHGKVESLLQDIQHMINVQNEQSDEAKQVAKAWDDLKKRSRLADAANAINTMALQIAQTFAPVLGFVAGKTVLPATAFLRHHQTTAHAAAIGGATMLAAMGIGRFTGIGRRLPGPLGRIFGGASLGQRAVQANAIQAAISGGGALGASPQNPVYVTVVGQLFGGGTSGPSGPGGGGPDSGGGGTTGKGGGGLWNTIKRYGGWGAMGLGKAEGIMAKVPRGLRVAGIATAAEMPAIPDIFSAIFGGTDPTTGQKVGGPWWKNLLDPTRGDFKTARGYQAALQRAQQLHPGTTNIESFKRDTFKGRADIYMKLDITDPMTGKKKVVGFHVPVDMWQGGRHPANKGKKATRK